MGRDPRPPSNTDPRDRSDSADLAEDIRRFAAGARSQTGRIPRREQSDIAKALTSPLISQSWNDYIRRAELSDLSDRTIRILEHVAKSFVAVVGDMHLIDLSSTDVEAYIVALRKRGLKPSTISTNVSHVRSWLNWCLGRGRAGRRNPDPPPEGTVLSFDPARIPTVRVPKTQRKVADADRLRRLLDTIDTETFDGQRFLTQVLLMLDTGVRAGETCAMDVGDVSSDYSSIRVWGKGAKERSVLLSREMVGHLRAWMERREAALSAAGLDIPVLFPSLLGRRQTSMQVGERFRTLSARAKITPPLTAHSLRHLWTQRHVRSETNPYLMRQMGGWADMNIVMTYVGEMSAEDAGAANQRSSLVGELTGRRVPRRR